MKWIYDDLTDARATALSLFLLCSCLSLLLRCAVFLTSVHLQCYFFHLLEVTVALLRRCRASLPLPLPPLVFYHLNHHFRTQEYIMDRSWIHCARISDEYERGVEEFIQFAQRNAINSGRDGGKIRCPCVNCLNGRILDVNIMREHLLCDGFLRSYTTWTWHGELLNLPRVSVTEEYVEAEHDDVVDDRLEDMIRDVGAESFAKAHGYGSMSSDAETPLYPGSTNNFTRLSVVLRLMNLKALNGWTDKSFTELLQLLKDMLPEGNTLPNRNYEAKKILCPMGMEYKKIHACPNDCILYRKDFELLKSCLRCGLSRYKLKQTDDDTIEEMEKHGPPMKVMWYLPIIPRMKRLFANPDDAKNLRWHADERKCDGMYRHPADSVQWKKFDDEFPEFGKESRNIRLGLATDGMNPFGNDIDVYLSPLIEDLKLMWDEGVQVFDRFANETFKLHAMLFCTINDFPAYGNLSVYLRHRRFLRSHHPYRRLKKAFNGHQETSGPPTPLTAAEVYEKVNNIDHTFGKSKKKSVVTNIWKKKSIFFDLPYWSRLEIRHCIDVMHVEKNVCDSLIGTLLNINGKTKDGLNARLDLVEMNIRGKLAPIEMGKRTYLPPACYTMSKNEKVSFCQCLKGVKVPQGHSSNVKSLVSMQDLKLIGLKSHDCHILMQQLLPVAIRGILLKNVRHTITRLCSFFSSICCKVIDPLKLDELQDEIIVILCELEMFFPPSFFDIMVHLLVHLVREVRLCGSVYLRWMYPVERYMKILKGYVKNHYRPEASMIERYIAEESIEFCSDYMSKANPIGLPANSWQHRRSTSKCLRGVNIKLIKPL
ncbi:hypothetical protein VNO80_21366 [Phaseolus coccineus]|uniref:Transposase-associated domain-containing protein n=1 Tax=Phaseolus coccineus TaxID=3886 RepID=A0AAN9M7M4_PHACN